MRTASTRLIQFWVSQKAPIFSFYPHPSVTWKYRHGLSAVIHLPYVTDRRVHLETLWQSRKPPHGLALSQLTFPLLCLLNSAKLYIPDLKSVCEEICLTGMIKAGVTQWVSQQSRGVPPPQHWPALESHSQESLKVLQPSSETNTKGSVTLDLKTKCLCGGQ